MMRLGGQACPLFDKPSRWFVWILGLVWIEMRAMTKLSFPFTEEKIRALKVGDEVLISGIVFTGRVIYQVGLS